MPSSNKLEKEALYDQALNSKQLANTLKVENQKLKTEFRRREVVLCSLNVQKAENEKEKMIEELVSSAQQAPFDKYLSTIKKTKQVAQPENNLLRVCSLLT